MGEKKLEILQSPFASRSTYYLNGKKEVHGVSIQFGSLPEKYPAKGNLGPSEEQEYEFSYSIIVGNLEDHLLLQAAGIKDGEVHVELNIVYQRGWGKEMTLCGVFPLTSDGKFVDGEYILELYQDRVEQAVTPKSDRAGG